MTIKVSPRNNQPTVSVVIPSYNHGKFIEECLQGVLDQTYQDFEIVITDDGSQDDTVQKIKKFDDDRIRLFVHEKNLGATVAGNNCLANANGKYIAMLSSDDVWYPDKLEKQVEYLENNPNIIAVFGKVDWIDEDSQIIPDEDNVVYNVFNVENRSRYEWMRHFFYVGNCLCHPSSLVRRELYQEVGGFDYCLAKLPDFDLWIRLSLKFDLHIMDDKLLRFRLLGSENNASSNTLKNQIQNRFEYKQISDNYLEIQDVQTFEKIFPEARKYGEISEELIPYFLGRLAIETQFDVKVLWGLEKIYTLMQSPDVAKKLRETCNFSYLDFIKLTGEHNIFRLPVLPTESTAYKKIASKTSQNTPFSFETRSYAKEVYLLFRELFLATKRYLKKIYDIIKK